MKTYSVIRLDSKIPTNVIVGVNDNLTGIIQRYDSSFTVLSLLPAGYQGKVYGWSTHVDVNTEYLTIYILINPDHNFNLLKHTYDEIIKVNQYGFNFDATNVNVGQEEYAKIFGGVGNGRTEFMFLEILGDPAYL